MGKYIKNLEEATRSVLRESIVDDLAEFLEIEKDEVEQRVKALDFATYLELGNAMQVEDEGLVREILDIPIEEIAPVIGMAARAAGAAIGSKVADKVMGEDELEEDDVKLLDKPTLSLKEIAKKHDVSFADIAAELATGIKVELEHTDDRKIAKEIALDHLMELPDYYTRLDRMENESVEENRKGYSRDPWREQSPKDKSKLAKGPKSWGEILPGLSDEKLVALYKKRHPDWEYMEPSSMQSGWPIKKEIDRRGISLSVEEADNPYAASSSQAMDDDEGLLGRKEVDDLAPGDPIEVVDIDGDPTAVKVKNPRAPGDTIVVQTDKGEEHIVKKRAVSGTPQMEGATKDMLWAEAEKLSREEFVAKYGKDLGEFWDNINETKLHEMYEEALNESRYYGKKVKVTGGYYDGAVGIVVDEKGLRDDFGQRVKQLMIKLDNGKYAELHVGGDADATVSLAENDSIPPAVKGKADYLNIKVPVDANNKNTRVYLPRSIRGIFREHGIKVEGKTTVSPTETGVVVRMNKIKMPAHRKNTGTLDISKEIYDKLNFAGYNVPNYPTWVGGGINVFVDTWAEDEKPQWNLEEDADKIKPISKMGYAPKAGSWKRRMHKAQPPENHEKAKKRHKKNLREDGWLSGVEDIRRMKPTSKHRPAIWENMLGTVFAMNDNYKVEGFDYDYKGAREFANLDDKQDKRVFKMSKKRMTYRPHWDKSKDEYERPLMVPRRGAVVLWVEDTNLVKPAPQPIEEARNASNTEHSGAKKGKGGYYGRKKDAKSDSNKKRRENDKKAITEVKAGLFNSKMIGQRVRIMSKQDSFGNDHFGEEGVVTRASREHTFSQMVPFIIEYGVELDSGEKITIRREHVRKVKQQPVEEEFKNTIFDKVGDRVGTPLGNGVVVEIQPMDDRGQQLVRVKMDKYADHDGDTFTFGYGDLLPPKGDEALSRIRKLAGIKETASGGATGAGAVAVGAVATGDMVSRDPGIYGKTEKPKRKKRKTKEEKSDGIGRSKKE